MLPERRLIGNNILPQKHLELFMHQPHPRRKEGGITKHEIYRANEKTERERERQREKERERERGREGGEDRRRGREQARRTSGQTETFTSSHL